MARPLKHTRSGKKGGFLKGKAHATCDDDGCGIPAVIGDSKRPVELEGGEVIINKKSMADDEVITVTGTPKQIASAINSMDNNGVVIEHGAEMTDGAGRTQIMAQGGNIVESQYFEGMLAFLNW